MPWHGGARVVVHSLFCADLMWTAYPETAIKIDREGTWQVCLPDRDVVIMFDKKVAVHAHPISFARICKSRCIRI